MVTSLVIPRLPRVLNLVTLTMAIGSWSDWSRCSHVCIGWNKHFKGLLDALNPMQLCLLQQKLLGSLTLHFNTFLHWTLAIGFPNIQNADQRPDGSDCVSIYGCASMWSVQPGSASNAILSARWKATQSLVTDHYDGYYVQDALPMAHRATNPVVRKLLILLGQSRQSRKS